VSALADPSDSPPPQSRIQLRHGNAIDPDHREKRNFPGYELVKAEASPRLTESKPNPNAIGPEKSEMPKRKAFGVTRVTKQDVLHIEPGFPGATIIADLSCAPAIPDDRFDCIILTQTLHYIFDLLGAIATLHRILKPGGTLLVTLPGISRLCTDQADKKSDCWRFTESSAERLFSRSFGGAAVSVRSYGNVLAAISFLEGLASHELRPHELDHHDPHFPVTIAVAAAKQGLHHEIPSVSLQTHRASLPSDREGNIGSVVAVRDA
jgi:SAM-dependent methyltransferase